VCCFIALLAAAACEKKSTTGSGTGTVPPGSNGSANAGPVDTTPLNGIDLAKLDDDKKQMFYRLVSRLNSPCGKSENLRTSFAKDVSCKRAPYAVRYVLALIEDEASEDQAREAYVKKYESKEPVVKLDVSKAPRVGATDAPVRLVEFFDYACPHCADFKTVLDEVVAANEGKVIEYFMMYPLGKWPHSKSAGQAAIAAYAQGKFKEMHAILFSKSPDHSEENVKIYAASLNLDMAKFEADYKAAAGQVDGDRSQGEAAKVESTPTLFFNDRKYDGPMVPKYISMWIEEELAVNR
jgi:protein-disulfide isomerase